MNSHIEKYLDRLRAALDGLDRSTIQDALSNAEDHLNAALTAEMTENPGIDRNKAAQAVIERYGSPEEIRDVYADIEEYTTPVFALEEGPKWKGFKGFLSIVAQPRAWAALLYMVLSMVTGTFYFSWAVTGISTSVSLIALIIGIPVTMLFFLSIRGLGFVEGRLVEALLGVRMPRRAIIPKERYWWDKFKVMLKTGSTWTTLIYMIMMLPLGLFYFSLVVTFISTGIGFIGAPIIQYVFNEPIIEPDFWVPWYAMPVFMAFGGLIIILTLHLTKFIGKFHGKLAKSMLVS